MSSQRARSPRTARGDAHLVPASRRQRGLEHLHVLEVALDQDFRRHLALQVILSDELRQHFGRVRERRPRKERRRAEAAAAPDEHQGDAELPAPRRHGDDVGVVIGPRRHDLLRLQRLQVRQLIAQPRRLLEFQALGCGFHAPPEILLNLVVTPLEHLDGRPHVAGVAVLGDEPDARGGASLNLVLQAGTRAVREIGVLAVAQPEELLQLLQGLANRTRRRVRPEEPAGLLARAPIEREARKIVARVEMQERKALVVAEQDVEARAMRLDEVELEQQRLGVGVRDGDFHAGGLRHQRLNLGVHVARLEVGAHPALQVSRLADVENLALGIQHAIHARTRRKTVDERLRIERRRLRYPRRSSDAGEPCGPFDDGLEHRRGQAAGLGVVPAAVIRIDEHPAVLETHAPRRARNDAPSAAGRTRAGRRRGRCCPGREWHGPMGFPRAPPAGTRCRS